MIDAAVIALLLASPGVTALVSRRVKPQGAPEVQGSEYPHVTVRTISNIPSHSNLGRVNLWRARVQVDCWGKTLVHADLVAREVLAVLAPRRTVGQPAAALWIQTGIEVHNGRAMQGPLPFPTTDVRAPGAPNADAPRVFTDYQFEYSLTS